MSLKTILHSDLAKALTRMAADKVLSHDVVSEIINLTASGVKPEGAGINSLVVFNTDGMFLVHGEQTAEASPTQPGPNALINAAYGESPKLHESGFAFGSKSRLELMGDPSKPGVLPALSQVVGLALRRSTRDFMVFEGSRTLAKQKEYVAKGTSKTLKSAHLPQADGTSHAVDLVPIVNGVPSWADWEAIYEVALAMDQAATELGVADRIVWGCAWDRRLSDFGGSQKDYALVAAAYGDRQRAAGNNHPLIDGPHFEWR